MAFDIVLRDPGSNFNIVLETAAPPPTVGAVGKLCITGKGNKLTILPNGRGITIG